MDYNKKLNKEDKALQIRPSHEKKENTKLNLCDIKLRICFQLSQKDIFPQPVSIKKKIKECVNMSKYFVTERTQI